MPERPLLEIDNVVQQFPAVRALDGVTLTFRAGTVHGIVGENGAGKSTLMRIISGLQTPTSGTVRWNGASVRLGSVREAERLGIAMIHQELNLVDELSVAENVFLGREFRRGPLLNCAAMQAKTAEVLTLVGAPFAPSDRVGDLSLAAKQLVEIAKAVSHDARLIVMDEPTAVLSGHEVRSLFQLIHRLKEQGVTVLYISHLLKEVLEICDEVTVMRDGKVVGNCVPAAVTPADLARMMVGRELGDFFPPIAPIPTAEPVLEVRDLLVAGCVQGVSFDVRPGEIVGLAGLIGSGRTETAEAIAGIRAREGGTLRFEGKDLHVRRPIDAVRAGIAYVSEDRKGSGLHMELDTAENLTLANLNQYGRFALKRSQQVESTKDWVKKLDIRVGDLNAPIRFLSGGNQQKVSVAKWLERRPKLLILDEPTRGVDVGAKREIYNLIQDLAREGLACLVISSEMTELIGLCHRILVLRGGRIAGELKGDEMTEQNIMLLAAAVEPAGVA